MKLWKKLSVITMTTLLAGTAAAGAAVIYHSLLFNEGKTIENYEQQLNAVSYAVGKELDYEPLKGFNDTTANAYYDYIIKKFDASSYILLKKNEVVCNMTPFLLTELSDERWEMLVRGSVIQKNGRQYILLAGRDVPEMGDQGYKLILVRDISSLYEDIRRQAFFYFAIYLGMALAAVFLVFVMTKKALAPLRELQRAAQDISGGMFCRRADVSARDETGEVAEAFNSMAERIERQVEELSSESERRRQMLGALTHEMKTPMTSIMGYADSLLHVNLSQEQKESALRHIYDECGRLGRVNSKLMSLIGMYDNDSISMEETSIEEVFEAVAELEEKNMKSRKMALKHTCRMNKRFMDKDLMISLLVNLVDNAARASEEGACIYMTARENTIAVRDNGCGIPKEEIPRVTEAFYMVDKARSRKAGGNGLGLALCSRIAKLHGADLRIESEPGEGTEVSVVFPE
ncbi:MAG: HAMP domain-containing histidine kinase [Lachnospiraceae bacterium]|nr:HAMP domain-containing histidine kinase [Lachnospiraceae bacterium]